MARDAVVSIGDLSIELPMAMGVQASDQEARDESTKTISLGFVEGLWRLDGTTPEGMKFGVQSDSLEEAVHSRANRMRGSECRDPAVVPYLNSEIQQGGDDSDAADEVAEIPERLEHSRRLTD